MHAAYQACFHDVCKPSLITYRLPRWLSGKESTCQAGDTEDSGSVPGSENPLEEEMATHSNILAWKISWTKKPGGIAWGGQSQTLLSTHAQWTTCVSRQIHTLLRKLVLGLTEKNWLMPTWSISLKQHRFQVCGSTCKQIVFNKHSGNFWEICNNLKKLTDEPCSLELSKKLRGKS